MKKVLFIAATSIALSGCATLRTADGKIDRQRVCELAIGSARTVQDITSIALRYGAKPELATRIANGAIEGEFVAGVICEILVK